MIVSYDDGEYEWIDRTKEKYELMTLSTIPRVAASSQVSDSQTLSASFPSQTPASLPSQTLSSLPYQSPSQPTQVSSKPIQTPPNPKQRSIKSQDDQEYIPKDLEESSDEEVSLMMEEDSEDMPINRFKRKVISDDSDSDEPIMKRASLPNLPSSKKKRIEMENPLKAFSYQASPVSSKTTTPIKPRFSPSVNKAKHQAAPSTETSFVEEEGNSLDKKGAIILGAGEHTHDQTAWMQHPQDRYGHNPTDPEYDPTSLLIPAGYLKSCSNGMKQWWAVKQNNHDCVLLMKVGKFYETYHHDADIMVKELDLVYMKGEMAHAGFPEAAYSKFSNMLVNAGYRVARMEQTETPQMLKERNSRSSVKVWIICGIEE